MTCSGIATIYAVKSAGLAIGFGVASSCIVLSSFTWGIFVFEEEVHSKAGACAAVACLMVGLLGMSYYSSPTPGAITKDFAASSLEFAHQRRKVENSGRSSTPPKAVQKTCSASELDASDRSDRKYDASSPLLTKRKPLMSGSPSSTLAEYCESEHSTDDEEIIMLMGGGEDTKASAGNGTVTSSGIETVVVLGHKIPKRRWGIFLAGVFGLWGGSIMAPMKLAKSEAQGAHFLLSFSIGASIVTLVFWAVRYLFYVYQYRSLSEAYGALPELHIRVMWVAGGTSGMLWSIGNFFNLITVSYLGQGVGYPLVQSSMLVSGLWGIFYFKEVQGTARICKWLLSSLVTLCGILLLGYERVNN